MTSLIEYSLNKNLAIVFKEFTALEIYGTIEEPYFLGTQVQEMLGTTNINYNRDYDLEDEYVKLKIYSGGQHREHNMFTKQGLYSIIAKSRTELGKKFRKFMKIVFRELRLNGQVTMDCAINKLKKELGEKDIMIKVRDDECERMRENELLMDDQFEDIKNQLNRAKRSGEKLYRDKCKFLGEDKNAPSSDANSLLWEKAKEKGILTPYYFTQIDNCEPADDEDTDWTMSKTKPKDASFTIYTFRDVTKEAIYNVLIARNHGIQSKNMWSATKFHGSMDSIVDAINSIMLA